MNEKSSDTWVDPDDAPELDDYFFKNASRKVGGKEVSREEFKSAVKAKIGRPVKKNPKVAVSIRLDPVITDYFKSKGKGWQTQMNDVLLDHVTVETKATTVAGQLSVGDR